MTTKRGLTLYHGTKPGLIDKIMKEGLDPAHLGTAYEGSPEDRGNIPTISLSTSPDHAAAYMSLGASDEAKGFVGTLKALLGVGVPSPLVVHVPHGFPLKQVVKGEGRGGFDEYHALAKIPPEWIKRAMSDSIKKMVSFGGMKIAIDRPKGFVQEGKDKAGVPWKRTYKYDYGFIKKTNGGDGEELDVFVGPEEQAEKTYWVSQKKEDGSFDELKVFVGFDSPAAAKKAYLEHIPAKLFGSMETVSLAAMRSLLNLDPMAKQAQMAAFSAELQAILIEADG